MLYLYISLGAIVGALLRYLTQNLFVHLAPNFPYGTMLVNWVGCFIIGMLLPLVPEFSVNTKALVITGFLGALTTFSSFAFEVTLLAQSKKYTEAALYWLSGSFGCVIICVLGVWLSERFFQQI